ncbi:MAG TPA: hypothetical protein VGQ82_11310, partial [Chthoniobacterales bacterium]|nr:hypothetical protein [Chthoniobacterales bacterium]
MNAPLYQRPSALVGASSVELNDNYNSTLIRRFYGDPMRERSETDRQKHDRRAAVAGLIQTK